MSKECLIIDDVDAAIETMSPEGRTVVADGAGEVRACVLDYAARRRWEVIPYAAFVGWARGMLRDSADDWRILDPLFPMANLPDRVKPLRVTRVTGPNGFDIADDWFGSVSGTSIGLLDDAAASGSTLRYLISAFGRAGVRVASCILCASTRAAHGSASAIAKTITWNEYAPGDWTIMHLRDGCPHLPFTGRRIGGAPRTFGAPPIDLRLPATCLPGTPWQSLYVVSQIRAAIDYARAAVVAGLSEKLCRPATVADLALLGANVPALVQPDQVATAESLLRDLMPGPAGADIT